MLFSSIVNFKTNSNVFFGTWTGAIKQRGGNGLVTLQEMFLKSNKAGRKLLLSTRIN